MADTTNDAHMGTQPTGPSPDLKRLERLVGTWAMSGDVGGTVTYAWMEGGYFLLQHIALVQEDGHMTTGLEVIGHLQPYNEAPSADIHSRYYSGSGETLDYVYELDGDTLTIWMGERDSPAYYRATLSSDNTTLNGAWHYPGGGGYTANATRIHLRAGADG